MYEIGVLSWPELFIFKSPQKSTGSSRDVIEVQEKGIWQSMVESRDRKKELN